jgi:hypothetical protein
MNGQDTPEISTEPKDQNEPPKADLTSQAKVTTKPSRRELREQERIRRQIDMCKLLDGMACIDGGSFTSGS